jgi:hypothetical protein
MVTIIEIYSVKPDHEELPVEALQHGLVLEQDLVRRDEHVKAGLGRAHAVAVGLVELVLLQPGERW